MDKKTSPPLISYKVIRMGGLSVRQAKHGKTNTQLNHPAPEERIATLQFGVIVKKDIHH